MKILLLKSNDSMMSEEIEDRFCDSISRIVDVHSILVSYSLKSCAKLAGYFQASRGC